MTNTDECTFLYSDAIEITTYVEGLAYAEGAVMEVTNDGEVAPAVYLSFSQTEWLEFVEFINSVSFPEPVEETS